MVMAGASLVGSLTPANSGMCLVTASSSDSLPSSRSARIARAVKLLVIDAIRKIVWGVAGWFPSTSRMPTAPEAASSPSTITPQASAGAPILFAASGMLSRIAAKAPASFSRRA